MAPKRSPPAPSYGVNFCARSLLSSTRPLDSLQSDQVGEFILIVMYSIFYIYYIIHLFFSVTWNHMQRYRLRFQ